MRYRNRPTIFNLRDHFNTTIPYFDDIYLNIYYTKDGVPRVRTYNSSEIGIYKFLQKFSHIRIDDVSDIWTDEHMEYGEDFSSNCIEYTARLNTQRLSFRKFFKNDTNYLSDRLDKRRKK